eukprot:61265-Chlamydomonas_euryale.AAC.2
MNRAEAGRGVGQTGHAPSRSWERRSVAAVGGSGRRWRSLPQTCEVQTACTSKGAQSCACVVQIFTPFRPALVQLQRTIASTTSCASVAWHAVGLFQQALVDCMLSSDAASGGLPR